MTGWGRPTPLLPEQQPSCTYPCCFTSADSKKKEWFSGLKYTSPDALTLHESFLLNAGQKGAERVFVGKSIG